MYCETGKDPFCQQGLLIASQTTTKNGIIEFCWPEEAKACFFFPPSFFFLLFFFFFFLSSWKVHQPTYFDEGQK